MRTNNIEDVIVNQIIQEVLEEAGDIRTERQKTYNNSFVECYNNYGIDYILGEVFNCSKRLQILRKSDKPDWKKIKDVRSDLINWAVLTSTCLKMEEKELTEKPISEGVVKDPVNKTSINFNLTGSFITMNDPRKLEDLTKYAEDESYNFYQKHVSPKKKETKEDKNVYTIKVKIDVDTSELEEVTTVINGQKNIKKENIEYNDYLMRILKFGLPKDIKSLSDDYYSTIRDKQSITFYNPKPHLLLEKKVLYQKNYVLNKKNAFLLC